MEAYSADLAEWVAKQLKQANPKLFQQLLAYYRQRGGPGLVLAEAELEARSPKKALLLAPVAPPSEKQGPNYSRYADNDNSKHPRCDGREQVKYT